MSATESDDLWEQHAAWWQRQFTQGADAEYEEQILPLAVEWTHGFDRVLEVGTGEGQVARAIAGAHRSTVVGIDPTVNQIDEAARRGGGVAGYSRSTASALPFADASFDAVVTCLAFEHVDELDEAISEVARVLELGGRFVLFVNHPLFQTPDSGWVDDQVVDPPEQYWRIGAYLTECVSVEEVERDIYIRFVHRPLSRYVNCLADHGLTIERMIEPAPPAGFIARAPEYAQAAAVPRLLVLVTAKHDLERR